MASKKITDEKPMTAVEMVEALGGKVSPDMETCVICGKTCRCAGVEFGSAEYVERIDRLHGRR